MAAVLTEPETVKAAVISTDMVHLSVPIEKAEDTEDINPVDGTPDIWLTGKATDGTLDSDLQVVDPEASLRWLKAWSDSKGNIRMQHDAKRPVGHGFHVAGHEIKALVSDPLAKHFVRKKVLNDFSIGIINADVRKGDPRFRHLDPMGKAVNGIITDRSDGTTGLGEISVVDRGANYGSSFSLVKAAADGSLEWTGTWTSEPSEQPVPKAPKGVTITLPKDVSVTMKPTDLAKLATFKQRLVTQHAAIKAAAPAVLNKAVAGEGGYVEAGTRAGLWSEDEARYLEAKAAETGIYKRDIDTATRRRLHSQGRALDNLSYPIETHEDADNAVTLALSGHGNVSAAKKMIRRIASKEGWQDILDRLKGAGKKSKAAAAEPDITKCMTCDGSGMSDGKECPDCKPGKATAPVVAKKKGKMRAICPGCGAKQNPDHKHCPECGQPLPDRALQVKKNHDFVCLGCGHELDKGEPHCPECGKENPGYLPEADRKIPANEEAGKSAALRKDRVPGTDEQVTKGKNRKSGKKGGKKGKPFGGKQSAPFGAEPDDGEKAEKRRKGKGKGRSPAAGVKGHETMGLPPHREPDGAPVEQFENDSALQDGDQEMKTAMRHKSAGVPPHLAVLHDLTCPAFAPAEVTKALPHASFAGVDTQYWVTEALKAASGPDIHAAREQYAQMQQLNHAAVMLKTADPDVMARILTANHDAFLHANGIGKTFRDATPGPGSAPTPGHVMPGAFRRPYISAGHAAESPQAMGARTFPVSENHPEAEDYTRGYISAGHAAESPASSHHPSPMPETSTGMASRAGGAMAMQAHDYESARATMHDHLSRIAPGMCPMSPEPGHGTQKPAPQVPAAVGAPEPHAAKTSKAQKAAAKAKRQARIAKAKARTAARKARAQRRFDKAIAAGIAKARQADAPAEGDQVTPDPAALTPETLTAAVKAATAPLVKQLRTQDKALRKQGKVVDAIAGQRDTTGAPYRAAGGALNKQASATVAPPRTAAEAAALAQSANIQRLNKQWRESYNPAEREAAWRELTTQLGINPMTGQPDTTHPFRT